MKLIPLVHILTQDAFRESLKTPIVENKDVVKDTPHTPGFYNPG